MSLVLINDVIHVDDTGHDLDQGSGVSTKSSPLSVFENKVSLHCSYTCWFMNSLAPRLHQQSGCHRDRGCVGLEA